jgi:2-methylcitrate dehydratase PrpD
MTVLTSLASFVVGASAATLPEQDRATQEQHFVDAIVGALAGARSADIHRLRAIFCDGIADQQALLAATIRLTEIDDIHLPSCTTPSSVVVPIALLLGGKTATAHAAMRDALWVGLELLVRLGAAVNGPAILYREVWPTYLATPLAAAATAARLLRLDERQTAIALSIALTLTAGGSGRFDHGASPRWVLHGIAVRLGILAVRVALEGYGGDVELLDRDWLKKSHGVDLDLARLTGGLGSGSAYAELSMKPYCTAKQAVAAIEALRAILADGTKPDDIRSVVVRVPPPYAQMIDRRADRESRSSTFAGVRYQMALLAYHPDSLHDVARDKLPWDERMVAFMDKVRVERDESLLHHYPTRWPASVTVETPVGEIERTIVDAPGDPGRSFDATALASKAHKVLDPLYGASETAEWLEQARGALKDFHQTARLAERLMAQVAGRNQDVSS